MKIAVEIQGGLGNQMFQYAFAKGMNVPVCLDVSWFNKKNVVTPRKMGLADLCCNLPYESHIRKFFVSSAYRVMSSIGLKSVYPKIYEEKLGRGGGFRQGRYIGYFQDEKWFKHKREELERDFCLKYPIEDVRYCNWMDEIQRTESVAVHVRRGDYLNPLLGWINLGVNYYREAIKFVKKHVDGPIELLFFSDDEDYVRSNLIPEIGGSFVDARMGAVADLMLMKSCKHHVIANSSFSWWAGWLNNNPRKVVVAPSKWNVSEKYGAKCPSEWHLI